MWKAIYILIAVCAGTGSGFAQRTVDTDAVSKVLALERLWGQAAAMRDINALDAIFDESLAYISIDGRFMTKTQVLTETRTVPAVDIVMESSEARTHGSTVIVTGTLRLKGVEKGTTYFDHARFVDTWMYKEATWVCVASVSTRMDQ